MSFEKKRSELNKRRDEKKNANITFIQKKWREYKLKKILKDENINFIENSKTEISTKCKNYVLDTFLKNTKINQIINHFDKAMNLWNDLITNTSNIIYLI